MRKKVVNSKKKPDLSIVIPVYNEAENIEAAISAIEKNVRTIHETIVVYDDDNDSTLPPLKKLIKKTQNIYAVKNSVFRGPSGAIRTGFLKARGERILVTMADLCDDLSIVDNICKLVPRNADIVCPSRYCKGGGEVVESKYKAVFPRTAGFMLKLLTGINTSDPTNSYKLYSKKFVDSLDIKSTVSFSVTLEIIAKAHCLNKKIYEIPTVWHDRQHGKTNFKILPSIIMYSPWFTFALLKNRLFTTPLFLIRKFL